MHLNVTSLPPIHYRFDFDFDLFSFPWNCGVAHGHVLQASSYTNEWKIDFGIIFRFDIDITSLWWRSQTAKGASSSWSQSFSNLVLLYFSKLSQLDDFVESWPYFWWWTWNRLWRLLQDWRHFYFHMVFNFWRWALSLVA